MSLAISGRPSAVASGYLPSYRAPAMRAGKTKLSRNRLRASMATASTAPVFRAFWRIFSMSSPWPRSTVKATTSRLYFSPIQGTMTEVSRPPEYARMTLSRAMVASPAVEFAEQFVNAVLWKGVRMASTRPRLLIPPHVLNMLMGHALRELPNECCGVLAGVRSADGTELQVSRGFALHNVADDPQTEFLSEPRDMF